MKKLLLILSSILLFTSCENDYKETKKFSFPRNGISQELKEINIDGCQYLYGDWGNATVLTHKGNCNSKNHSKKN
jgi:hypothetical protein